MDLNIKAVTTGLWLVQVVAVTFLVAGFVAYDMHLWREAYIERRANARCYQRALIIVPLLLGAGMLYGGYVGTTESVALINVGLFIISLPLFDERISQKDFLARLIGVTAVWVVAHAESLFSPLTVAGSITLAGLVIAIYRRPARFRYNLKLMVLATVGFGSLFWLTVPWRQIGIVMDWPLLWQAIIMYLAIGVYVAYYWRMTHVKFIEAQRIAQLDAYEHLTNEATYRRDQADIMQLMTDSRTIKQPLSFAVLDVDNYEIFNREHGHMSGNATLIEIAEVLERTLQTMSPQPHLYRSGGEEFNIAFPGMSTAQAVVGIKACLTQVRNTGFVIDGQKVSVTLSAGVTAVKAADATIDVVYKRADDNLRLSKKRGRDMYTCEGKSSKVGTEREQLAFFAQPIELVTADHHHEFAEELLLRAYDARQARWVLPKRFDIQVEAQIALIRQVLTTSNCQSVTINLTLAQFADPTTAMSLAGFKQADYGPQNLTVEITDVPDLATMRRITAMYREADIRILIDDVGSDNSYELVQKLLPYVDGVKFAIQNLRKAESIGRIRDRIGFWADVAQRQDIDFVLEGVEDQTDVIFAQKLGVKLFQGYYFGKPAMPSF